MPGPRPKPTRLKVLEGNPGKRPLNKNEPQIKAELMHAPDWMTEAQLTLWRYAIHEAPEGVLGSIDRDLLSSWVVACDLRNNAIAMQRELDKTNQLKLLTKTAAGTVKASPYLQIINKQSEIMIRAAAELGFTPSSRSRISVDPKDSKTNPFGDL